MSRGSTTSKPSGGPNVVVVTIAALLFCVGAAVLVPQWTSQAPEAKAQSGFDAYEEAKTPPEPPPSPPPEESHQHAAIPEDLPEDSELTREMKPGSRIQHFEGEGEGWARVTDPGPNAERPPTPDEMPEERVINDEIPEEKPQTTEWKMEKTNVIFDHMAGRLDRLEKQIQEAEEAGDEQRARHKRLLMKRTEKRLLELEKQLAEMRAEAEQQDTREAPRDSRSAPSTSAASPDPPPSQIDAPRAEEP